MKTTIGSQIDLLMLIEKLEINGIHVISANTDGILCLFSKTLQHDYRRICNSWENQVGNNIIGKLEYTNYISFVQTSVNDYLAIKKDGERKTKGDFTSEYELHKSKKFRIIPLALQEYFINNIKIEDYIHADTNIFNFTSAVKGKGIAKFIALNKITQEEKELQKINRYYVSSSGIHLLKVLPKLENKKCTNQLDIFGNIDDGSRESEVQAGYTSIILNNYIKKDMKDYNIDYRFYIDQVKKIINLIE